MRSFPHKLLKQQRSREARRVLQTNGKPVGPLHGLPISLKDQFHVKGNDTTMGYIGWIDTSEGSKDKEGARTQSQ